MADRLERYNEMRDFARTEEPTGETKRTKGRAFVVQKHAARRLHYDFRLEHDGVLLSWAVPKGPSLSPSDKRLAVRTEDHPVAYKDFEGTIPEGQYGGGSVIVWDKGTFRAVHDLDAGLAKGHIAVELDGEKLHGRFDLVRLRAREDRDEKRENWLLVKAEDGFSASGKKADIVAREPKSVLSDRTVLDVAKGVVDDAPSHVTKPKKRVGGAQKRPNKGKRQKGEPLPEIGSVRPSLATLVDRLPAAEGYGYEIKYDGYRALAWVDDGAVTIVTRNGKDWTRSFPEIADALARLRVRKAIFDGEIVHVDADGKTDFQKLQNALGKGGKSNDLAYFVFDLLHCDGVDFTKETLRVRKEKLRTIMAGERPPLVMGDHAESDGKALFEEACKRGLEGIVAKRLDARYASRRTHDWLKVKCQKRQELVIVGYTAPKGSRSGLGALLLGVHDDAGALRYAGKVGTGFSHASLVSLAKKLAKLVVEAPSCADPPRIAGATWVRPALVCQVRFTEWTSDGRLRHPAFEGLREDKPARAVSREEARDVASVEDPRANARNRKSSKNPPKKRAARVAGAASSKAPKTRAKRKASRDDGGSRVRTSDTLAVGKTIVTHADRVVDRASGLTKGELVEYAGRMAPWILPHAEKRPLMLLRCGEAFSGDGSFGARPQRPGGAACFVQKHGGRGLVGKIGKRLVDGEETLYLRNDDDLVYLFQMNTVELHGWGSRFPRVERPDWIVFDLDPDEALPFAEVAEAALELRAELAKMGLETFVKTTGGKGLHVVLPLAPTARWPVVRAFAELVARGMAEREPDRFVATMSKRARKGKIFVDYLRNGRGATAVLPYSPRAREGAPVAMPIAWSQVRRIDPRAFDARTVPAIVARRKTDPWAGIAETRQELPREVVQGLDLEE